MNSHENIANTVTELAENITEQAFEDFHKLKERERNAEEGYGDTRNDVTHMPDASHQSPSKLLSCHRMSWYDAHNTPREDRLPYGIFKFGHDFEAHFEEFLAEHITGSDLSVRNVERVEFSDNGVDISGTTDPVVFDENGNPVALFEVKTTQNTYHVRNRGEANERHRAQAHAYVKGLMEKYDLESPPKIFYAYGGREDLDVFITSETFDATFWNDTVLQWAETDIEYRNGDELPPALEDGHEREYQCTYCDYQERCGNYDPDSKSPESDDYVESMDEYWWNDDIETGYQNSAVDLPATGFVPAMKYPEDAVVAHIATHGDVELTPTIATQYPELVADGEDPPERFELIYGVAPQAEVTDWVCDECLQTFDYDAFEWESGSFDDMPTCPECPDDADSKLRGEEPGEVILDM
jgi:hypothetical protein